MSGFMRSAAGRTAAARSRSAGMPRAGPGRGRSSPRAWRTVTGPSSSALPARAWTSAPEPGNRRPGRRPKPPPRAGWSTREYAAAYAVMKWPLAAAHTRAGIADALATITPALLTPERGGPPAAVLRAALYGHAFHPGRPAGDPARAGRPGAPPGWDPGRGHDHHPQAGRLRQLPRLRGRTRVAGSQPSGPHHMEAPEIVLRGRPAVNRHTCRGAGDPGRGHQDPPGADRVLRLPVLRGTATCRSRRAACRLLRPPLTRLGTADTHSVPPPVGACLDWQRHATRTAQPQTPPGRRHQDGPDPPAACPPPPLAPAGLRVRRRRAAVPGCPWRPAQRKPLRPDLAPGPRRSHAGGRDRRPAGAPPLRSASRRAVVGLASGAPPAEIAARAGHSVRVLLTIYAHCMPGCDQIASQHIEQALRPSR